MKKISLLFGGLILTLGVSAHQINGGAKDGSWNWNNGSHSHSDDVAAATPVPASTNKLSSFPEGTSAKVGECYAPAYVEGPGETVTKRIMVEEAYVEKSCNECEQLVPKIITETILVVPTKTLTEVVPALYENVGKQVLVKPARTYWKKGNFTDITKVVNGETYCLVEEPAEYETVFDKILRVPATTRQKVIPAVYETYEKTIYVEPDPIVYPAKYEDIEVYVTEGPGAYEWRSILCEENATYTVLEKIEQILADENYLDQIEVDGIVDNLTSDALKEYQRDNNIKVDGLISIDTVEDMGVEYK